MSLKYFEIKKLLRSQIGLVDSLTGKVMKYVLLYGILYALFLIGRVQDPDSSGGLVALLLIMGVLYRFNFLFEKINIKNLTIAFRKGYFLNEEHTEMLISDIELSLKKINSFANQTIPSSVVISLRKDRPVSLVSAFETPIKTKLSQEGYVNESIEAMFKEYQKIQRFVDKPEISFYLNLSEGHVLEGAKEEINLSDLLNDLGKEINNRL